jgi:phosphohistidine phosphatase SixA
MRLWMVLALAWFAAGAALADPVAAWAALREGGHVALMRHAQAPGVGDPPGFDLADCRTQRNLSEQGRADAVAAGDRLRAERIRIGRLLSSPWCRCKETAERLRLGSFAVEPAFSNAFGRSTSEAMWEPGRKILRDWNGPGNLLVVTHGSTIRALLGGGGNPASGEVVVVRAAQDGSLHEIGRLLLSRP